MGAVVKTKGHKKALLKAVKPVCGICLEPILHPETATVDHIVPLSLGGSNYRSNVQLAHPKCNRKKGNDPEFLPISLRKTRCPSCHRWYKNLNAHKSVKHSPVLGEVGNVSPPTKALRSVNSGEEK